MESLGKNDQPFQEEKILPNQHVLPFLGAMLNRGVFIYFHMNIQCMFVNIIYIYICNMFKYNIYIYSCWLERSNLKPRGLFNPFIWSDLVAFCAQENVLNALPLRTNLFAY